MKTLVFRFFLSTARLGDASASLAFCGCSLPALCCIVFHCYESCTMNLELMDSGVVLNFCLLSTVLLWGFLSMSFHEHMYMFLLYKHTYNAYIYKYICIIYIYITETLSLPSLRTFNVSKFCQFSKVLARYAPTNSVRMLQIFYVLKDMWTRTSSSFFILTILVNLLWYHIVVITAFTWRLMKLTIFSQVYWPNGEPPLWSCFMPIFFIGSSCLFSFYWFVEVTYAYSG